MQRLSSSRPSVIWDNPFKIVSFKLAKKFHSLVIHFRKSSVILFFFCVTTGASAVFPRGLSYIASAYSTCVSSLRFALVDFDIVSRSLTCFKYVHFFISAGATDPLPLTRSRGSSIGIAMGYRLDGRSSIPGRNKRFVLFHVVHTYYLAPKPPIQWVPGGSFPRG
jgi:hypothetical protein